MIKLDAVGKIYGGGQPNEVRAIQDVSLTISLQTTCIFKGPSGSGKTTLLSMIGCLARPTSGRIHLGEDMISSLPEKFMTEVRRKTFGFIFQRFNLIRGLTALENVIIPALPLGGDHRALIRRAKALLCSLQLEERHNTQVELLSGGEAQRVAIARALINDPPFIIADEPTANLDGALIGDFLNAMEDLKLQGKTILISSHDPRIWQAALVDMVVSMEDGRVINQMSRPVSESV